MIEIAQNGIRDFGTVIRELFRRPAWQSLFCARRLTSGRFVFMKQVTAIVIGAGARGKTYADYALENPSELKIVGVAEPNTARRNVFQKTHCLNDASCFSDWKEILGKEKMADVAIIATMDQMHYAPAIAALKLGYDLLLEKPISPSLKECEEIASLAKAEGRKVLVCHVLRYTPFFQLVKQLVSDGAIGDIVSIQHNENVGYLHQVSSFVRGNWRKASDASPMILQKSCHDLDILQWLAESEAEVVSSFGGLYYFKKENAPDGAPEYCMDGCAHSLRCPYYAPKIYLGDSRFDWMKGAVAVDISPENISKVLPRSQYGRCVFHCDNDVVDHQVVNIRFKNNITVAFTMCAFTQHIDRTLKIMGTKGELKGKMNDDGNEIRVFNFETGVSATYYPALASSGHGGGDAGIVRDLVRYLNGYPVGSALTEIEESLRSHRMAWAAEQARLEEKVIYC